MSKQDSDLPGSSDIPTDQGIEGIENGGQGPKENNEKQPEGKPETIGVRNLTPHRLTLKFENEREGSDEVTFAPLENRTLTCPHFRLKTYKELDNRGHIELNHHDMPQQASSSSISFETAFWLVAIPAFLYFYVGSKIAEQYPDYRWYYWLGVPILLVVVGVIIFITMKKGWTTVGRGATQSLTLLLVMAIGLGLTAATIYFFGDGPALIQSEPSLALLARVLQGVFIAIAALLPALLYYLFDRQQLGTLRDRFESQIFNLDPTIMTLADVRAKYGRQLDELYGRDPNTRQGRLVYGTRWPILICTVVITAGWIITLQPVGGDVVVNDAREMFEFLAPQLSVLSFGFLGAYYFALNMILRRYTRGDLQPKAYSHITVRILIVTISAWVVEMLFGANLTTYMVTFIIGIIPDTFFTVIREFSGSNKFVAWALPQLEEKHPLSDLEGIDLYDRSRLAEEGVTNVDCLAHHDLIDLILATRIPVSRLVDWVDQAILYLHVKGEGEDEHNEIYQKTMHRLRQLGIRNASDFINVLETIKKSQDDHKKTTLIRYLESNDSTGSQDDENAPSRIELVYATMQDDDWLNYILHWRKSKAVGKKLITIKPNGVIEGVQLNEENQP